MLMLPALSEHWPGCFLRALVPFLPTACDECCELVLIMRVTEEEIEASAETSRMEHLLREASIKQPRLQY